MNDLYVYITYTAHNIFINCYKDVENGQRQPVGFKQLSSNKLIVGKSKKDWDNLTTMAETMAKWISTLHQGAAIVIFKNFGSVYKRRAQTSYGIEKKRNIFIDAFSKVNIPMSLIVDTSTISFNGCKTKKNRRKKKKHMVKHHRLFI